MLGGAAVGGAWTVHAANPATSSNYTYSGCTYSGYSFENDAYGIANSQVNHYSGTCTYYQWDIHVYFLGSDSLWHYYERFRSSPYGASLYFCEDSYGGSGTCWWSGEVYGYGKYGYGTTAETHAY